MTNHSLIMLCAVVPLAILPGVGCSIVIDTDPFTFNGTGAGTSAPEDSATTPEGTDDTETSPSDSESERDSENDSNGDTDTSTATSEDTGSAGDTASDPDTGTGSKIPNDTGTGSEMPNDTGTGDPCEGGWIDKTSPPLCWEEPYSQVRMSVEEGDEYCENKTEGGGGWRLPTIDELRRLIVDCETTEYKSEEYIEDVDCPVRNNSTYSHNVAECSGCTTGLGPSEGGCYWPTVLSPETDCLNGESEDYRFWSSSGYIYSTRQHNWFVDFSTAYVHAVVTVNLDGNEILSYIRCVKPL